MLSRCTPLSSLRVQVALLLPLQSPLFAVLGRLTQQYVLDMHACSIHDRLHYLLSGRNQNVRLAEVRPCRAAPALSQASVLL
jgi:hypothetical protein